MKKQLYKLIFIFFISVSAYASNAADTHYAMVVDAGSSGSRLYLFSYTTDTPVPNIIEVMNTSVQPGLSSYANQPASAGPALKPMLDSAAQKIQTLNVDAKTVSISVYGTAGMRLLDDKTQTAIYAAVENYIQQNYSFKIGKVETITGKMEGVYGWLDINYLLGTLQNGKTVGEIDMGGASTQIAYEADSYNDPTNQVRITINHHEKIIYSKSFLGLGLDESRKEMNQDAVYASCYPNQFPLSSSVFGHFNFGQCERMYEHVIANHHVQAEIKQIPDQQFIAYSGAYYTFDFLGIHDAIKQSTVENNVQAICSHTWDELKTTYPTIAEKNLANYCANGVYLDDLFYGAYHLHDAQVSVTKEINHTSLNWTLGALLFEILQ